MTWLRPVSVIVAALVLAALDVLDRTISRWWDGHALITDTASGLLVLLITVLIVDEVVRRRQLSARAQATAAQAAILGGQARRASRAVLALTDATGVHDTAVEELRTYLTMLLVAAPVLIEAPTSRTFLEDAQRLGGVLASILGRSGPLRDEDAQRLRRAGDQLRASAEPLLDLLDAPSRDAVSATPDVDPAR